MRHSTRLIQRPTTSQAERERRTIENQTKSPLLRLPAELRNRIYDLALSGDIIEFRAFGNRFFRTSKDDEPRAAFALPKTCLQIHSEASLLPFTLNTFALQAFVDLKKFASNFTQAQLSAIKTLEIRTFYGHLFVDERREDENLSVLAQFSGLKRLEIIDQYQFIVKVLKRERRWSKMVAMLREWVPDVGISIQTPIDIEDLHGELTPAVEY